MVQQANKKVVGALQGNKLTIKDVRVRTKFWYKPFAEDSEYLDLICYTGWEPWKDNYKFIPMPQTWEEIQGGKARRGIVKQLDDFMAGYRDVVDAIELKPKQNIRQNYNVFDLKWENERLKNLSERNLAGKNYTREHGKGGIDIPVKDVKGNVIDTYKLNKNANFFPVEYFVVANANNTLTINTINYKQLDFLKPDVVFFWRGNKYTDAKKTNRDFRKLYWVRSVSYINDKKGTCQLVLEQCDFWLYWGNACNSKGKANIFTSQLGMTHGHGGEGQEEGKHYADEAGSNNQYANENYCRACDMCFDFCGDLRLKRAVPIGYKNPTKPQWQPKWRLLAQYTGNAGRVSGLAIPDDDGGSPLVVPSSLHPVPYVINEGESKTPWGTNPVLFFLVAKDHNPTDSPISKAIHKPAKGEDYWEELPACYAEQPHLLNHSTLQAYFQKKLLFTANFKHLKIRKFSGATGRTGIAKDGLMFKLGYHILERSSIAGILYNFESQDIFFKWELKVEGTEQSMGLIDRLLKMVEKFLGVDDGALQRLEASAEGGGWMSAIPKFFRMAKMAAVSWLKKQIQPDFKNMMNGEKYKKQTGLDEKGSKAQSDKNQAQAEEQTKRQKASTAKALYRAVEPSIFYSNTISMNYSFWEFANRTINSPFMLRCEHSNLLYDNLINNNNKNPIQTFNCKFSQLKQLLAEGDWSGQVAFYDFPHRGFFEGILADTTLYKNPDKYFTPWQPIFKTLQSFTYGDTSNMDVAQGQEEADVDEIKRRREIDEDLIDADISVANYGNDDYIGSPDAGLWQQLNQFNNGCHPASMGAGGNTCLGCLCSGGSHNNPNYSFERIYDFTTGGTLILKTANSGTQECEIPPEGGKVKFWAKGNSAGISMTTTEEWTEKHYKYNFKFDRIEAEKEDEIVGIDYKEPNFQPSETEADIDIEQDNDQDKDDVDFESEGDKDDAGEREEDDDWDSDIDKDRDQDEDTDADRDDDNDLDTDFDFDKDKDDDDDKDAENDIDKDKDKTDQDAENDIDNTDDDKGDVDDGG